MFPSGSTVSVVHTGRLAQGCPAAQWILKSENSFFYAKNYGFFSCCRMSEHDLRGERHRRGVAGLTFPPLLAGPIKANTSLAKLVLGMP